jgi:hypothetical protein
MNTYWKNTSNRDVLVWPTSLLHTPVYIKPNQTVLGEKKTVTSTIKPLYHFIDIGNGKYIEQISVDKKLNAPNTYIVKKYNDIAKNNPIHLLGYSEERGAFRLNETLEPGQIITGRPVTFNPTLKRIQTIIELGGGKHVLASFFTPISKSSFDGIETENDIDIALNCSGDFN